MDTKEWNTGYAAGYKAGLQRAVAICRATRDAHNKQEGRPHTPIGDMAAHCGGLIHALIDQPIP
jgi:hypothetical protein